MECNIFNTDGLDEGIRCAMCINPMANDRGCDGSCSYNEKMYSKILSVLGENVVNWTPIAKGYPRENICDDGYIEPSNMVLVTKTNGELALTRYWGNRTSKNLEILNNEKPKYHDWLDIDCNDEDILAWMPFDIKPFNKD